MHNSFRLEQCPEPNESSIVIGPVDSVLALRCFNLYRFSGWLDVGLTAHGEAQAAAAGDALRAHGYTKVDECHTSALCRASDTLALCLKAAGIDGHDGHPAPPIHASWQLNERHYGALTGLRKDHVQATLGAQALAKYRRDFDTPPPPMLSTHPLFGAVYPESQHGHRSAAEVARLPVGESLAACHARVQAYVEANVHPALRRGETVVVAAHNNVLRTLMVHLDGADPRGSHGSADIPKAVPIVYHLDRNTLKVRRARRFCLKSFQSLLSRLLQPPLRAIEVGLPR
jgi:2,3-bisphosphoglycerate-dependent phosphoglycerate mutase